ncbi:MAG: hypothetical protein IJ493_03445 [Clostridia bacterium]|nr:hypothetical protein [Clostridia bacterium]
MIKKNANSRLLWCTLTAAIFLPLLNTLLLGSMSIYIGSDITYPEIAANLLGLLSELLGVSAVFAGLACVFYAWGKPALRRQVTLIAVLGIPLTYLAAAVVDAGFYGSNAVNTSYVLYSLPNCLFELVRLAVVILIARKIAKNGERSRELELFSAAGTYSRVLMFGTLAVFVSMLLANFIETVTLLIQYGAPLNMSELLTLILPYVTSLVYSVLGYLLEYLVIRSLIRAESKS